MYAAPMYKSGIDYDTVNARQSTDNYEAIKRMKSWLAKWDARLQTGALAGINRGLRTRNQDSLTGRVNINGEDED